MSLFGFRGTKRRLHLKPRRLFGGGADKVLGVKTLREKNELLILTVRKKNFPQKNKISAENPDSF